MGDSSCLVLAAGDRGAGGVAGGLAADDTVSDNRDGCGGVPCAVEGCPVFAGAGAGVSGRVVDWFYGP